MPSQKKFNSLPSRGKFGGEWAAVTDANAQFVHAGSTVPMLTKHPSISAPVPVSYHAPAEGIDTVQSSVLSDGRPLSSIGDSVRGGLRSFNPTAPVGSTELSTSRDIYATPQVATLREGNTQVLFENNPAVQTEVTTTRTQRQVALNETTGTDVVVNPDKTKVFFNLNNATSEEEKVINAGAIFAGFIGAGSFAGGIAAPIIVDNSMKGTDKIQEKTSAGDIQPNTNNDAPAQQVLFTEPSEPDTGAPDTGVPGGDINATDSAIQSNEDDSTSELLLKAAKVTAGVALAAKAVGLLSKGSGQDESSPLVSKEMIEAEQDQEIKFKDTNIEENVPVSDVNNLETALVGENTINPLNVDNLETALIDEDTINPIVSKDDFESAIVGEQEVKSVDKLEDVLVEENEEIKLSDTDLSVNEPIEIKNEIEHKVDVPSLSDLENEVDDIDPINDEK